MTISTKYKDGIEYSFKNKRVFITNSQYDEVSGEKFFIVFTKKFKKMSKKDMEGLEKLPSCELHNRENLPRAMWVKPNSEYTIFYSYQCISEETINTMAFHTMVEKRKSLDGVYGMEMNLIETKTK